MKIIQLTRLLTIDGKAVKGILKVPVENDILHCVTIENSDYIIPAGDYPLDMTYSPRWRKLMPEICNVPGRTGIRIHMGTQPEHSKGCVLVSFIALSYITSFINKTKKNNKDETIILRIIPQP